jgi:hypothetical protein
VTFAKSAASAAFDMNKDTFFHLAEWGMNTSRTLLGKSLERPFISIDSGMAPDRFNQVSMSGMAVARIRLGMQIDDHRCGVLKDIARQVLQT